MDYNQNMYYWLDDKQIEKLDSWKDAIKLVFGDYGLFEYTFSPFGIDENISVYSTLSKTSIEL